jgi:chaperonin GroES
MVDIMKKLDKSELKNFEPALDMVLLEVHEQRETAGGVVLPEGYQDRSPQKATVVAVGKGRMLEDGGRGPMQCEVGDVVYMTFRGNAMKFEKGVFGDREYLLMQDQQVTGFYRKEGAGKK